ncbi:MAG: phytanoyl-CoA dioxygenase family protein [Gammaproteobacteria bacterium]
MTAHTARPTDQARTAEAPADEGQAHDDLPRLDSRQMASFAARGFLRLDAVVPADINAAFLDALGRVDVGDVAHMRTHYGRIMASDAIPVIPAGVPLADAYPPDSPISRLLDLPIVRGAIQSLVGRRPIFDHHFLHIAFPPTFYAAQGIRQVAQHYHQDSTIDPRAAFDIQIMYYPHAVTADMGGTRYLPGSHLRVVSEAAIGRYQNIRGQQHVVCPAGTLLFMHHGIWHGAGINRSNDLRYMFKIRIQPGERQRRLWDTRDLPASDTPQRPIFWTGLPGSGQNEDSIAAILCRPEPWHEADTGRLEFINRIRFWQYLLDDPGFDADYWVRRIENEPV